MYEACQLYRDVNWKITQEYVVPVIADQKVYTVANHEQYIQFGKRRRLPLKEQKKKRLPGESIDSITAEIKHVSEILPFAWRIPERYS